MTDTTTPAPNNDLVCLEDQAWECDKWPEWLHDIVGRTNDVADRLDMSSEQAHAYAVLIALEAQSKEIEALRAAHGILNEAVEIIAGDRHCADNLMGNAEVAIDALRRIRALKGA